MTFVDLQNNTLADADVVMDNFRHANFGNNLIPMSALGAGVDDSLDIGSGTYRFKNAHFARNVFARDHARASGGYAEFPGGSSTCPNNAWTPVHFRVSADNLGELDKLLVTHSSNPNDSKWDLQARGVFLISMCVTFLTPASGSPSRRGVGFRQVGSTVLRGATTKTLFSESTVESWALYEHSYGGPDIEMVVFQDSGSALGIRPSPNVDTGIYPTQGSTRFEMWRLK